MTEPGDPVYVTVPVYPPFHAIVGHKEACRVLPDGATLLAAGAACPVQMFRMGQNVYNGNGWDIGRLPPVGISSYWV